MAINAVLITLIYAIIFGLLFPDAPPWAILMLVILTVNFAELRLIIQDAIKKEKGIDE